jgi:hypothetical protein
VQPRGAAMKDIVREAHEMAGLLRDKGAHRL